MSQLLRSFGVFLFVMCAVSARERAKYEANPEVPGLGRLPVNGGLVVHVGCGNGELAAKLHVDDRFLVHGIDRDAAKVAAARKRIGALGLYGKVSADVWSGTRLPYTDNLVRLLVISDRGLAREEALRVLAPEGVAIFPGTDTVEPIRKKRPDDIDVWTHYLHDASNNAVADDAQVGPPRHMQWTSGPRWGRSHEYNTSLSSLVISGTRLFTIYDESIPGLYTDVPPRWNLICKDAFSGVTLWRRPMKSWGEDVWNSSHQWRMPSLIARRLVATEDSLFVTLEFEGPLYALEPATGEVQRIYADTKGVDEILHDNGQLILRINPELKTWQKPTSSSEIALINPATGKVRWRKKVGRMLGFSMAVADDALFYHDYQKIHCLDRKDGRPRWSVDAPLGRGHSFAAGERSRTLIVSNGVVLHLRREALLAIEAKTGKTLWKAEGGKAGHFRWPDLFAINNVVWYMRNKNGLDLRSGKAVQTIDTKKLISGGHHPRCHRGKATTNYLIWAQEGAEFVSLRDDKHMRHNWLRGTCMYGVVPANGFTYGTPHACFCYPGVNMRGFNAVSTGKAAGREELPPSDETAVTRGPAFGDKGQARNDAWPMYRHDARRSGTNLRFTPDPNAGEWQFDAGTKATPPIVAGDDVLLALPDRHQVMCLRHDSGQVRWSFRAGARVDSPPIVFRSRVYFGSADGFVYALRQADGALMWRFRAAPEDRRIVSYEQVESSWPVHGSVLVLDGRIYCTAGRSSFMDGGIYVYALDPDSGNPVHSTVIRGPWPDITETAGHAYSMEGSLSDLLVSDGSHLYMMQIVMNKELQQQSPQSLTHLGDKKMGLHLSATGGFLDSSGFSRLYWMYARRWPGFYYALQAPKSGQLISFDEQKTYTIKAYTGRRGLSPYYEPGTHGYLLMADAVDNEPYLHGADEPKQKPINWLPGIGGHKRGYFANKAANQQKGTGFTRVAPPVWQALAPVRMLAMAATADRLYVAGVRDELPKEDPLAAFEGRRGGWLLVFDKDTGDHIGDRKLDVAPTFDGLIAARGRLYLSTKNGTLQCLSPKADGRSLKLNYKFVPPDPKARR